MNITQIREYIKNDPKCEGLADFQNGKDNNMKYVECDPIPNYPYPPNHLPILRKRYKAMQVWQYPLCDWDSNDAINNENWLKNLLVCGMIICDDCIILATHGCDDGYLYFHDLILDILTSPNYASRPIYIHCCYPHRVRLAHPELADYLLYNYHDNITAIRCHLDDGILETFLIGRKE